MVLIGHSHCFHFFLCCIISSGRYIVFICNDWCHVVHSTAFATADYCFVLLQFCKCGSYFCGKAQFLMGHWQQATMPATTRLNVFHIAPSDNLSPLLSLFFKKGLLMTWMWQGTTSMLPPQVDCSQMFMLLGQQQSTSAMMKLQIKSVLMPQLQLHAGILCKRSCNRLALQ